MTTQQPTEKALDTLFIEEADAPSSLSDNDSHNEELNYLKDDDIALSKKTHLINNALNEIGFTPYHLYLMFLAGFGYSADSQIAIIQGATQKYAIYYQYNYSFPIGTLMSYVGLFFGAIIIGFSADLIGRKTAFNYSLLLTSLFSFLAGGSSSIGMYLVWLIMTNLALGGNLALDVTLLLEYLPTNYQYLNTFLACFWAVGQTVAELLAWAFIPNYSCSGKLDCDFKDNRGWRYVYYSNASIVLIVSMMRLFFFKFEETPKFLISNKRDAEAVEILQNLALKYNRKCSLTLEQLNACGEIQINDNYLANPTAKESWIQIKHHVKLLFSNKTVIRSNSLIIISWFGIGITYGIYNNFLYAFLAAHGADTGTTTFQIYRDAVIGNAVSFTGPIIAAAMLFIPGVGRRFVMCFGGVTSMIILMCYTTIRTEAENIALSSISYIFINVYYGTLYAYTPEALPTATRATGSSLALSANRFAGMLVPVIYYYSSNSSSAAPIYVCGAVIGVVGLLALALPFEPSDARTL
ncbi:hypothetical protein CANARDRAFT_199634 [[Candida] arabinofermentans NRRL YB-2248]|uniref:Major facilitator superfamily (MFS) profile domain-containing protein n=1 Tax=[Candida] arabinofermentans NRRL YB-2248 TaxID=983967 RepID=A0A1E4SZI4_9ASCO|nr:hypothetical protein CANARDRAFT_199634 [[Candida] arabinofermentans NRRL YB-2248]